MITTILIVLVAVVVLIVIIAVLALRYLRADDSDTFDEIPDEPRPRRAPERHPDRHHPGRPEGRQRQREPVTEAWTADRPVRPVEARGQVPGYRDRDTGARPAVPDRPVGQRRPAGVPQSARAARADDPDAATNSWESLSDVDYWAELSADKPQLTAASGPAPTGRRAPDGAGPDPRQASALQRQQPARSAGPPPGRSTDLGQGLPPGLDTPSRRNGGPRPGPAQRPAAAAQRPATGPRQAPPQRQQVPASQAPPGNGLPRLGPPADDDPLTSPSFPAINTADSRSYRTRRSSSQPGGTGPNRYPAGPDRVSRPEGYPVQSPATPSGAQAAPLPSPSGAAGSPAANPYGSYLSAPQAYQGSGYPDGATAGRAPAEHQGYPAAAQAPAGNGHYPAAADGYLPADGLGAAAPAKGRHAHNGTAPRGHAEIDYGSLRYDDPAYPDAEAAGLVGYAAPGGPPRQYEQRGYGAGDPGYSQDGYQRHSGYGAGGR